MGTGSRAGREIVPFALAGVYGIPFAALVYSLNQLVSSDATGPWLEASMASLAVLAALASLHLAASAWQRFREGRRRPALARAMAAAAAALICALALSLFSLLTTVDHLSPAL